MYFPGIAECRHSIFSVFVFAATFKMKTNSVRPVLFFVFNFLILGSGLKTNNVLLFFAFYFCFLFLFFC